MIRLTMVIAAFSFAACGTSDIPAQVGTPGCQILLSGAVTASADQACAVGASAIPDAGVAFAISATGTSFGSLSFAATLPGSALATGMFGTSEASAFTQASTTLTSSTSQAWVQSLEGSSPDAGSATLEISSTGSATPGAHGETAYQGAHGILSAALVGETASGASGNVAATVTF